MKLEDIDESLLEFGFKDVIKAINLGKNIKKMDPDQVGRDAVDWMFNKKIPNELDKYGQRRQQQRRSQHKSKPKRRPFGKMDGSFLESATAGATASGNIATVSSVPAAYRKIKKGKNGLPKAPQALKKDGTAKNAIDTDINLMGGVIKR